MYTYVQRPGCKKVNTATYVHTGRVSNAYSRVRMLRLELALVFPEEKGMMQQSSVSISSVFENQGINPVGGSSKLPRTYTNKQEPRNQRDKGVVNPFTVTYESEI